MHRSVKRPLTFIQGFLMLHLIWFLAYLAADATVIPAPQAVYAQLLKTGIKDLPLHIGSSLFRIFAGLFLALITGIPIGILMAYHKKANQILYPFIYFCYPIPKTALLPVAMLLLGMRDASKITIVYMVIVFQVIVSVRDSVQEINPSMYQVLKAAGARTPFLLYHVTLPAMLPSLLTSLRISLGTAVAILFFVESYGTKHGMGYYIIDAWSRIQYDRMYLGILILSVLGFLLFELTDILAEKLPPVN